MLCPKYQQASSEIAACCNEVSSLGVMVKEGQGLCPPQPTALLAFNCAILQITFLPKLASLLVCMSLVPVVLQREVSRMGDMLQGGIQFSASSLSLACMGSPGLHAPHCWGPHSPHKASFVR